MDAGGHEGLAVGEESRSKKPEWPTDVRQKQEEDKLHLLLILWLLASGFYLELPTAPGSKSLLVSFESSTQNV